MAATPHARSAALEGFGFVRQNPLRMPGVSAALLLPCFWHAHIEAGDLGSDLYNAWLTQLVERGQAPGLWIAHQWNNTLFDRVLLRLGSWFGWNAAEKIAVVAAVLIFFWGVFALVGAAVRRAPWTLVPIMAMLAYGWTFSMGLFNFYISLGLSFFALALLWRGNRWDALLAAALLPLMWIAHPLGPAFLIPAAAYLLLAERTALGSRPLLMLAAAALVLLVARLLSSRYPTAWWSEPLYIRNGLDQFILYGDSYGLVAVGLLLAIALLVAGPFRNWTASERRITLGLSVQLVLIAELALLLLPDAILLPQYAEPATLLMERFSVVAVVFACCALAGLAPRNICTAAIAAVAVLFFTLSYFDTLRVNRMEGQAEALVSTLPPHSRVISAITRLPGARLFPNHIVDRACIGRCFVYSNDRPASQLFRLRANPGNGIVTASVADSLRMQAGVYAVRPEDLPLWLIYQCDPSGTKLCLRELAAGDMRNNK